MDTDDELVIITDKDLREYNTHYYKNILEIYSHKYGISYNDVCMILKDVRDICKELCFHTIFNNYDNYQDY